MTRQPIKILLFTCSKALTIRGVFRTPKEYRGIFGGGSQILTFQIFEYTASLLLIS